MYISEKLYLQFLGKIRKLNASMLYGRWMKTIITTLSYDFHFDFFLAPSMYYLSSLMSSLFLLHCLFLNLFDFFFHAPHLLHALDLNISTRLQVFLILFLLYALSTTDVYSFCTCNFGNISLDNSPLLQRFIFKVYCTFISKFVPSAKGVVL